jgi:F-type H+-transporting ATPase subunit a
MSIEVSLYPEPFVIMGVNVGLSVVIAWCVLAVLLALLVFLRLRIRRFTKEPRGLQNALEMIVDGISQFAESKIGHHARLMAPLALTLMTYVSAVTLVELFGIPPPTEDINCTFALGLCSFIAVNAAGFSTKGFGGRIKSLATPSPVVFPIRVLTDCIAPCSMAIRLFANIMVGGVIMQLIYNVVPIVVPAVLSVYFNLLHVGIQTFVFGLLSLTYAGEAVE